MSQPCRSKPCFETEMASLWAARVSFGLRTIVGLYVLACASVSVGNGGRRWRRDAHHDHAGHAHGERCGCKHVPSTVEIETASRCAAAGVVLAIGLRPCSGSVLVLMLAAVMDLAWHGALAALAMSLGPAITIVTLAILATRTREWASAVVAHRSPVWILAGSGVGVLGGAPQFLSRRTMCRSRNTVVKLIPYIVALNDRECGVWGRAHFNRRYGNDD